MCCQLRAAHKVRLRIPGSVRLCATQDLASDHAVSAAAIARVW